MFKIYKRFMDVFVKGELIKIKSTGEVFTYESCTGGANFSSRLVVNVGGTLIDWSRSLHVDDVLKVDIDGLIIDDFESHKQGR
jgi:hypothetical protein